MSKFDAFLIVPAWSDQAGYCRIVYISITEKLDLLKLYRTEPERFLEAGKMNSQGRLVYLNCTNEQREDIKACEPLMAGEQFFYKTQK